MKKGLLLSVVASGFIFAGGNIAPVAPVAQPSVAPAACDFWGSIGARYEFIDADKDGAKLGDKENNTWKTTVVLGVEKEIGNGFGIGAEVAATSQLGLEIANKVAEDAELSELYLTYKNGNTLVKAGRQALPKSLSPWAWTDTTLNRKDTTFEGVVVVNQDLADTVLVGAWIAKAGSGTTFDNVNGVNNKGLFAVAAQNKSLANTTLTGTVYYVTEAKVTSVWASAETKLDSVKLGFQAAYAKASGSKKSYSVAAYAKGKIGDANVKLSVAHLDNGDVSLNQGGTSAIYGVGLGLVKDVDTENAKRNLIILGADYALPYGKLYTNVGYETKTKNYGARLGYTFKVSGVSSKVEYRYRKVKGGSKDQRIRIEGVYKF